MNLHKETRIRSLSKTIIWRIIATLITWGTIYYFTKELSESITITTVAAIIGMTVYYIHERIWNNITWGKV